MAHATAFQEVPQIDIGPLLEGTAADKAAVGQAVRDACINVGFFYVRNHGVAQSIIDSAFHEVAAFFALPEEKKTAIHAAKSQKFRGYTGLYEERHDAKTDYYEPHEVLDFGRDIPESDPVYRAGPMLYGPNVWPDEPAAFRPAVEAYYAAMLGLSTVLVRAFALALGLDEDYFVHRFDKAAGALRYLHYPANSVKPGQFGVGAHTDYECFTILAQDERGGLEVHNAAGEWIPAPPIPATFVINIGDLMGRWTNDLFASTLHRAANRTARSRYSSPFFVGPNADVTIACIEPCQGPANPPKYDPVLAGRHIQARLIELQQKLGREVVA